MIAAYPNTVGNSGSVNKIDFFNLRSSVERRVFEAKLISVVKCNRVIYITLNKIWYMLIEQTCAEYFQVLLLLM